MEYQRISFDAFLKNAFDKGNYATDDVIAFVMPLFLEVLSFHEADLVAPFDISDSLFITDHSIDIDEHLAHESSRSDAKLAEFLAALRSRHFDVVGKMIVETEVHSGTTEVQQQLLHFNINEPLLYPAYIKGYSCYEILLGHHSAQTDIFCLGLILGSMALGLDLYDKEDLKTFAEYRINPVQYNSRIHPTLSMLITEMTELDAQKRTQDLYEVVQRLAHYRDFDPEKQSDLSNIPGWKNKELKERSQLILNKLRNRLFDLSRRNRLLYYKPNARFVNLTVSSVPMVLHYQSIKPDLLFTWNNDIEAKVTGMKEITLNKYLRFEDHQYLPAALDKIRVESQRDIQEYGFSQLKLVIAFLNWHNLKEDTKERIQSPLLLIPVELKRNKKLKEDHYSIKIIDNEAEVNPVLANQLRELYGIKLPDFVELNEMKLEQFYQLLKDQIDGANQGIRLHYSDKPKIKLVHSIARQTVGNYKKRLRKNNETESYKDLTYSYQQEHFKPLGLEIFKKKIESKASSLEFFINEDISISSNQFKAEGIKERALFEMTESEGNPYSWDFDVCNIVLGNFNYKKMSLVRDYNFVIDSMLQHNVFDNLFSNRPRQISTNNTTSHKPDDWHHVVAADPTQTEAILKSRAGESYIIQGPPGTGKSQTITNLIADFVARGKRILFVCEKRAALDVVYHRLKQNGLDELCCYIHDSQSDKRDFIKNLKQTYEDFSKNKLNHSDIERQRKTLLDKMNAQLFVLEQFHRNNKNDTGSNGISIRSLIARLIVLKENIVPLSVKEAELLPDYNDWLQFGTVVKELGLALEQSGADAAFAEHPLSGLNDAIIKSDQPYNLLDQLLTQSQNLLAEIKTALDNTGIAPEFCSDLVQVKNLVQDAALLHPLAEQNNLKLIDKNSSAAKEFDKNLKTLKKLEADRDKKQEENNHWSNKLSAQDLTGAITLSEKYEDSFFSFFNGSWRRLKKQLNESYNFSGHQVRPSYSQILKQLQSEYEAINIANNTREELQQRYKMNNLNIAALGVEVLRNKRGDKEIDYLLAQKNADEIVQKLHRLSNSLFQLELQLKQCLHHFETKSITEIQDELESISMNVGGLQDLLPALRMFINLPPRMKDALRKVALTPTQAEATIAYKNLDRVYQNNRVFADTDVSVIEKAVKSIEQYYKELLKLNAELIRSSVRQNFITHLELSNTALSQLNVDQKVFKKNYNEGRKILENEFGKSIRFKSIRELSAKESGMVLKDIKPIWLMSPLSVSDSLPLDTEYFDVVIFDEASQITLEEGIPALYRSPQTIIVGDDKQMPPTNFFTAKSEDQDDLEKFDDDSDDELLSTDADSLLVQGSRKLDSTMLSWHYRSHYETLISFSNHAFYEGKLLTIPDKTIHHKDKAIIEVSKPEDAAGFTDALYDRSISFHFQANGIYEKRSNLQEAQYIAGLVKELLKRKLKESIGIVAFSQEQQHAIEDALSAMAQSDKDFEQLLEEAYIRTEHDQFVGLIIKNLENIQGDERDIIIMSVCYGYDSRKKMLMNFGPINRKGGEKRLNVIFSRAKKHMAVVSSIRHFNITNEYNEGANYFRKFLQYAENVSLGQMQPARTILDSLVLQKNTNTTDTEKDIVVQQLKIALEKNGFEVTENVGQSDFKCSLAVKLHSGDEDYCLGILIDDRSHYDNENLMEQYVQRPEILKAFGWKVMHVFAKDWLKDAEKVLTNIVKRINEKPQAAAETEIQDELVEMNEPAVLIEEKPPVSNVLPGFEDAIFERLVFKDEQSNKFWEVAIHGNKLLVRYGKVGSKGQVQIKSYDDVWKAAGEKEKMIREKKSKGYETS